MESPELSEITEYVMTKCYIPVYHIKWKMINQEMKKNTGIRSILWWAYCFIWKLSRNLYAVVLNFLMRLNKASTLLVYRVIHWGVLLKMAHRPFVSKPLTETMLTISQLETLKKMRWSLNEEIEALSVKMFPANGCHSVHCSMRQKLYNYLSHVCKIMI